MPVVLMQSSDSGANGAETVDWERIMGLVAQFGSVVVQGIGTIVEAKNGGAYRLQNGGYGQVPPGWTYTGTLSTTDQFTRDPLGYLTANPLMAILLVWLLWKMMK